MINYLKRYIKLNNGHKIPILGLGLSHNGGFSKKSVKKSLFGGNIKLLDTAKRYKNESKVGDCIVEACENGYLRDDFFVTTKFWPGDIQLYLTTLGIHQALENSLNRLNLEYIDLYLIHWPDLGGKEKRKKVWHEMERLSRIGFCHSIGISNFLIKHLRELLEICMIKPIVNQIEFNPFQNSCNLIRFLQREHIQLEGYCPFGKGKLLELNFWTSKGVEIKKMTMFYKKTISQILIRWLIQNKIIGIPKSTYFEHIQTNTNIWDFNLEDSDMKLLNNLHCNLRCTWDPTGIE